MRLPCNHLGKVFSFALMLAMSVAMTSAQAAFIDLTPTNGSNSSTSISLADLVAGTNGIDGIIVGDKNMSGFSYHRLPNDDMPDPQNISVLGFKDQNGNWGLSFHGAFLDMPGGGISDAVIRFVVNLDPAALRQGFRINDAHLFINGTGMGPNSLFFVDESFAESDDSHTLNAFKSTMPGGTTKLSDSTVFDSPLTSLHVTKGILAIAADGSGQPSRTTIIDQSFSQIQIPEPTSLILSLVGLVGLVIYRRHR